MGPEWLVLIGVVIIVVGFLLKLDVIAVVIVAAIATAFVSGLSFLEILELLGKAWTDNRAVSLFLLTLPMIALSERYGLKEQAIVLITRLRNFTPGRFLTLYTVIRQLTGIFGIRISGMVQFVRPIVHPMTAAAARRRGAPAAVEQPDATSAQPVAVATATAAETPPATELADLSPAVEERIKAESALSENIGNFFGQNGFVAASGVLLIVSTLNGLGYNVSPEQVALASLPMIVIAAIVAAIHFLLFDRRLRRDKSLAPATAADPAGPAGKGAGDVQ